MIRPAVPSDEAAIRRCAELAYARYVAAIGRPPAPMVADFAALIAEGEVHVAIGEEGVVGFIVFRGDADAVLLDNVAVRPDRAGRGVGKALIRFCEETARREGFGSVRLYTNAKMIENLAMYPRLGYSETGRGRWNGFDRVYFEKRLG